MNYEHMTRHDIATLARENLHWVGTLISLAKQNTHHADTLLDIVDYLLDDQYQDFDEMAEEFKQQL